jgi:hypothetical protein
MALFGKTTDIDTFKIFSRELINDVISQQVGYYKPILEDTKANIYSEGPNKVFLGPVLLNCLIDRGDFEAPVDEFGIDVVRTVKFRFLNDDLLLANVHCEAGDIVMYNELYYEVDNVNPNQLILGKDHDYAYSTGLENFGDNYSTIIETHYTRGDKVGITQVR